MSQLLIKFKQLKQSKWFWFIVIYALSVAGYAVVTGILHGIVALLQHF